MGLLNSFCRKSPKLLKLYSGSFTVDRGKRVLVRTLPSKFPKDIVETIGSLVVDAFKEANEAQVPLRQLEISYPSFKITARELQGGAIVFLSQNNFSPAHTTPKSV